MRPIRHMCMYLLLTSALLLNVGCASIVSKSVYPTSITSSPSGADITVIDKKGLEIFKGKTPATLSLKAGRGYFKPAEYQVSYCLEGYSETTVPVEHKLDGWYVFGNILVGGLIGWVAVDPITGAMWTLEDTHASLVPIDEAGGESIDPEQEATDAPPTDKAPHEDEPETEEPRARGPTEQASQRKG